MNLEKAKAAASQGVFYQWDIETTETTVVAGESVTDVIDHDHSDTCPTRPLLENERLVLVRDDYRGAAPRAWAYVTNGQLPPYFTDASKRRGVLVPERFHKALAAARPVLH